MIKAKENILIEYFNEDVPNLLIGDKIKVFGQEKEISSPTIPNNFDYKNYLYNQKIYLVYKADSLMVLNKNNSLINKIKNSLYKKCSNNAYLSLFILGDKSILDSDVYESYQKNGVAHLLAISGLHLGLLLLIINKFLFFIRENHKFYIITVFLLMYAYFINFPASFLRVMIFYVFNYLNKKYSLNINNMKLLFLTAFLILIINPFFIYNTGFQFSFITVFGIILCQKYLHHNYFINLLIITIISFVFTLPIIVNMNYEINLITFIANLLLVPLVSFLIYPFAILSLLLPFLLPVFSFFTSLMEKISFLFSSIEFTKIIITKCSIVFIIIYYLVIIYLIYFNKYKWFVLVPFIIIFHKYYPMFDNTNKIIYFDVKQGDSSLIIYPHYKNIVLIYTGGIINSSYNISDNIINYMKSLGVTKIDYLIITHGDYDHMGEAINLVNNFKVEKVIFNCGEFNDLEKELIKVLDKKKIKYYSCIKELNIDKNKLYFLQTKEYDNENDSSNVIYTELDGYKFMFMGDTGIEKEKDILDKYNLSNIDVLKVGHHGSKTSSGKEFIDEINPKYSIISVGKNNRYGHPNTEVLNNLNESKIYRTDQDGSIMLKMKNNKLKIETCSP